MLTHERIRTGIGEWDLPAAPGRLERIAGDAAVNAADIASMPAHDVWGSLSIGKKALAAVLAAAVVLVAVIGALGLAGADAYDDFANNSLYNDPTDTTGAANQELSKLQKKAEDEIDGKSGDDLKAYAEKHGMSKDDLKGKSDSEIRDALKKSAREAGTKKMTENTGNEGKDAYDQAVFDFSSTADKIIDTGVGFINGVKAGNLTKDFDALFGGKSQNGGKTPYQIITDIANGAVTTLGYSVLTCVCLVELLRISAKTDTNEQLPGVRDVVWLWFFFCIMVFLIDNAIPLCEGVYNFVNSTLIAKMPDAQSVGLGADAVKKGLPDGDVFGKFIAAIVFFLLAIVASMMTWFAIFARSLQLYVYAMFSPIALMFLGEEHTRSWGVGFIKGFVALCLAGAVIAICVALLPAMVSMAATSNIAFFPICACMLVYLLAVGKSGAFARDVLGG